MKRQPVTATARINRRKALLGTLIEQLERGIGVTTMSMKQALTAEEYRNYRSLLKSQERVRYLSHLVAELKDYNSLLRKADRLYAWAQSASLPSKIGLRVRYYRRHDLAEAAYEDAFECLEVLCERNPAIVALLDRPVYFNAGYYPDHNPFAAPRPLGSRSKYSLVPEGYTLEESEHLKLELLKASLLALERGDVVNRYDFNEFPVDDNFEDEYSLVAPVDDFQFDRDLEIDFE